VRTNAAYTRALEAAGLVPLVVPPFADARHAARALAVVDGLVLTGGDGARDRRTHPVTLAQGSRLAAALGATRIDVNPLHHQAVDRLAPGLRATAHAPDGVVEGVESEDARWWMLGVQWHPEELTATPEAWDRRLFAAFAAAVRTGR
jgi:gamma-glutamyl-gamma-aminobutyrate hydrolase PuuD